MTPTNNPEGATRQPDHAEALEAIKSIEGFDGLDDDEFQRKYGRYPVDVLVHYARDCIAQRSVQHSGEPAKVDVEALKKEVAEAIKETRMIGKNPKAIPLPVGAEKTCDWLIDHLYSRNLIPPVEPVRGDAELRNALKEIVEKTGQYVGCTCSDGKSDAGDCWPCRMYLIGSIAEFALEGDLSQSPAPDLDKIAIILHDGLDYVTSARLEGGDFADALNEIDKICSGLAGYIEAVKQAGRG